MCECIQQGRIWCTYFALSMKYDYNKCRAGVSTHFIAIQSKCDVNKYNSLIQALLRFWINVAKSSSRDNATISPKLLIQIGLVINSIPNNTSSMLDGSCQKGRLMLSWMNGKRLAILSITTTDTRWHCEWFNANRFRYKIFMILLSNAKSERRKSIKNMEF